MVMQHGHFRPGHPARHCPHRAWCMRRARAHLLSMTCRALSAARPSRRSSRSASHAAQAARSTLFLSQATARRAIACLAACTPPEAAWRQQLLLLAGLVARACLSTGAAGTSSCCPWLDCCTTAQLLQALSSGTRAVDAHGQHQQPGVCEGVRTRTWLTSYCQVANAAATVWLRMRTTQPASTRRL